MTTRPARDDILDLERRFWNTMRDKDGAAAARMTATPCVLVGAQGVSAIDPASMTQMMQHGQWTLKRYAFDD
jgi:limonene-1,2-epoxide hydrolase